MRAQILKASGGAENFSLQEIKRPEPAAGQVLIRIAATSVNQIDIKIRGSLPIGPALPGILGGDVAGTVEVVGPNVTGFSAGGVGSILTQIARRLTDLTVAATASCPETIAWAKEMGAHHTIDHHQPLNEGLAKIGISQVRYVAGLTATGKHRDAIIASLAPQGAPAMIDDPAQFDIVPFKRKSLAVHWKLMFTRPLYTTPDIARQGEILAEVSALVDAGLLRTTLRDNYGTINAANLRRAHRMLECGGGIGKIVLSGF